MEAVEPIRDPSVLQDMCGYLQETNERNFVMFQLGIYTGLRISDILKLRVKDVRNKKYIKVVEQKTGKDKKIPINPILKKTLDSYIEGMKDLDYLIKSREGRNKPLSRGQAYNIIKELGEEFGIDDLGTHTMRKTFGYHHYKKHKDVALLQKLFNHTDPKITLRYIGIEQDTVDKAIKSMRYF